MGDPVAIGNWLAVANEAKKLADPQMKLADSGLSRQVMASGGVAGGRENPNFAAIKQVGSGENAPHFNFVPFQDWFSPQRKRW